MKNKIVVVMMVLIGASLAGCRCDEKRSIFAWNKDGTPKLHNLLERLNNKPEKESLNE